MSPSPALAPLRLRAFRRLAVAHTVNELGDWLGTVALALLVFGATGDALAVTALFLAMRLLPAVLAPPLVASIDRFELRGTIAATFLLEAAIFAALAGLASAPFSLAPILVLAALDGTLSLASRSLTRAAVAGTLDASGQLRAGNALLNVGFTSSGAIGPALAGLIVAVAGTGPALLLDAGSFLLAAVTIATGPRLASAFSELALPARWYGRLREAVAYAAARPPLRRLIVAQGCAFVFFAMTLPIDVVYAEGALGAGAGGFGILLASWGLGMVIGSLLFAARPGRGLAVHLFAGTLAVAAGYLGLALAPTLAIACAVSVVGGVGNGVQWVSLLCAVQEMTPASMQARMISLLESTGAAAPALGFVAGGAVATVLSARAVYAVAGLGVVVIVAVTSAVMLRSRLGLAVGVEPREVLEVRQVDGL